jgi:hypothetical protein
MASSKLLEAVAVTAELCGRTFSEGAARVFVSDLSGYDEDLVLKALSKCRREVKGILTVADVIGRIDDGRPGPEEAWSMLPRSEAGSVVWTEEMAEAFGVASPLMIEGDMVAARMAFREAYRSRVEDAKANGKAVKWTPSLGWDARGRESVIAEAVQKGRISMEVAREFLPSLGDTSPVLALMDSVVKRMPGTHTTLGVEVAP